MRTLYCDTIDPHGSFGLNAITGHVTLLENVLAIGLYFVYSNLFLATCRESYNT